MDSDAGTDSGISPAKGLRRVRKGRSFFIPSSKRRNLSNYKYSGVDKSLMSRYVLSPYWNGLVKLFPLGMAPNAITLLGLTIVGLNVITMLIFLPALSCSEKPLHKALGGSWDPLFTSGRNHTLYQNSIGWAQSKLGVILPLKHTQEMTCPGRWIYFSWAIGLWMYQSLDAIDGKQARRTGTSGPLGEMFDHGCDAINTTLETLLTAAAMNLGQSWWCVVIQIGTIGNFYLSTWEEYHTGTLFLSAFSGPIEGILIIIVLYIITGFKGPTFWDQGILTTIGIRDSGIVNALHIKDLPLNECFIIFGAIGCGFNIISSYGNVTKARRAKNLSVVTPALGLLPFVFQAACNVVWLHNAQSIKANGHLVAFSLYYCLAFAYQVGILITAHTTAQSFPWFNILQVVSFVGALDAYLGTQGNAWAFQTTERKALVAVYIALVLSFAAYAFFVYDVVGEICDYFDINCLTIKHKDANGIPTNAPQETKLKAMKKKGLRKAQ